MVMIYFGFAGAAYNVDVRKHMLPGDQLEVVSPFGHTYTLTYEGLSVSIGKGQRNLLWQAIATVSVEKDGVRQDFLTTEKRQYVTSAQLMTEVGVASTIQEDLYLILAALDDVDGVIAADSQAQGIDLQVLVKPFVSWIWFGGLMLALGTIIALWPNADPRRAAVRPEPEPEAEATPAPAMAGAAD
jgi:cytochrome c-type biogenesis protein CcmF